MNALSIGAAGMNMASQRFDVSATQIASGTGDVAQQSVSMMQAKNDFEASAVVVKSADKMMGTLLNVLA
jgi:flagellar basal body rod protein FlgG